jgi:hypothetical protein
MTIPATVIYTLGLRLAKNTGKELKNTKAQAEKKHVRR